LIRQVYYFNTATRETSWVKPGEEEPAEEEAAAEEAPAAAAAEEAAAAADEAAADDSKAAGATSASNAFANLKSGRDGAKGARSSILEKKKAALLAKKGIKLQVRNSV
jgi:hypothetical protein